MSGEEVSHSSPNHRSKMTSPAAASPPPDVAPGAMVLTSSSSSANMTGVIKGLPSQYVKLNVGGCLYYTTIGTLTKHDNMLRAMFSGRMEVLTDSEGRFAQS